MIRRLSKFVLLSSVLPVFATAQPAIPPAGAQAASPAPADAGDSYYHFTMGSLYEQLFEQAYDSPQRSSYARQAIDHYRKAYALDPRSEVIGERLAEMYAKAQRIRDAVLEAQEILARDPDNLAARRLLARIYVRTLGDMESQKTQPETLIRAVEQYEHIVRLDPGDAEAAVWLARLYRFQNRHEEAEQVLRNLVASQPNHALALEQLAQLQLDAGRWRAAAELLEKETQGDDAPASLVALLGEAYAQGEQWPEAEKAFRRAVELGPAETAYRRQLARTLSEQGRNSEAAEQYIRLTEQEPRDPEPHLRLAQIYRRMGKLDEAERSVLTARQMAPGSLEVIYNEALIYESQGRFDDAIRVLSSAASGLRARRASDSNRRTLGILYNQLGRLYREVENYSAAISTYEEMRSLGPEEAVQARAMLIESYRADKQLDRAIAESEQGLGVEGSGRGARIMHALLLAESGDADGAARLLREQLDGTAQDREVYLSLAQAFERARRYSEGETAARKAEELSASSGEKEVAWFLLGAIYERWGKFDRAEEYFKKAIAANPSNAGALNYYGYMLAERGIRLDEAVSLVERALAEDPHNGAYLDSLGWAYFKQGRLAEAEEHLRRAVERSKHDPTIRDHFGDVLARLGRLEEAAAEWERALTEWKRSSPADYEAEKIAALEKKLRESKHRLAQQKATSDSKPER
jgi:tetratricopeptide (TPR) repeat protein